nr:transcription initiation factor TFIID subunit 13 [Tanacetum cinerariifolium]
HATFLQEFEWFSRFVHRSTDDRGFAGYPFDYRVTLGFGSIAGGLDHVNPIIRLPLKHGISRVLDRNKSSTDQLNSTQQTMVFSLITWTKIDLGEIIYNDLVTRLIETPRKKYSPSPNKYHLESFKEKQHKKSNQSPDASDFESLSCSKTFEPFDNCMPGTERHEEAAASSADLRMEIAGINRVITYLKEVYDSIKEDHALNKKVLNVAKEYTKNSFYKPLPKTVALVKDIVVEYVTDMVHKAQDIASRRGKLLTEDILFLIRKELQSRQVLAQTKNGSTFLVPEDSFHSNKEGTLDIHLKDFEVHIGNISKEDLYGFHPCNWLGGLHYPQCEECFAHLE